MPRSGSGGVVIPGGLGIVMDVVLEGGDRVFLGPLQYPVVQSDRWVKHGYLLPQL